MCGEETAKTGWEVRGTEGRHFLEHWCISTPSNCFPLFCNAFDDGGTATAWQTDPAIGTVMYGYKRERTATQLRPRRLSARVSLPLSADARVQSLADRLAAVGYRAQGDLAPL